MLSDFPGRPKRTGRSAFCFIRFPTPLIKWIKQRDKNVPFQVLEKDGSNEIIVDFLRPPGAGDWFQLNILRYARAADSKGLVAAHYLFRFQTGGLDGNELKSLRRAAIDAMAHFDMQPVQAYFSKQP